MVVYLWNVEDDISSSTPQVSHVSERIGVVFLLVFHCKNVKKNKEWIFSFNCSSCLPFRFRCRSSWWNTSSRSFSFVIWPPAHLNFGPSEGCRCSQTVKRLIRTDAFSSEIPQKIAIKYTRSRTGKQISPVWMMCGLFPLSYTRLKTAYSSFSFLLFIDIKISSQNVFVYHLLYYTKQ